MKHLFLAIRIASLLTLGSIVVTGSLWSGLTGGIVKCPFPLPFIMCNMCPVHCTVGSIRTGLFYSILGMSILFGKAWCGFICPGGAAQDMLFKLPVRKLYRASGPYKWLEWLKYFLAVLVILLILEATQLWQGIPVISGMWFWMLKYSPQIGNVLIALVAVSLVLSIFLARAWCRYLCPLGAWLFPFNRYSLIELDYDADKCVQCGECSRRCPTGIRQQDSGAWDSAECLRCLECYIGCKNKALKFKI